MAEIRQSSFGSGELSPSLYGADHLSAYAAGARTLRNMVISKYRTAINRPGTIFCGEVKDSSKLTRLLPFLFSDDQSYALETGELYERIWDSAGNRLAAQGLVALGQASARAKSVDKGATWSTPTALTLTAYNAVCEGANGRLIAVATANGSGIAYSDDCGVTWQDVAPGGPAGSLYAVAFNGRRLLAMGDSVVGTMFSDDNGLTWQRSTEPGSLGAISTYAVAWGNGRWIAVGANVSNVAVWSFSYDGETWSAAGGSGSIFSTYAFSTLWSVCFLAGQFIAVGIASNDGGTTRQLLWAKLGVLAANWEWGVLGAALGDFYGIASDGASKAVAVGGKAATPAAYIFDTTTQAWTSLAPSGTAFYRAVTYSRGYWVAVGLNRSSRYDGTAWTADPSIPAGDYRCIGTCRGTETLEVVTPYGTGIIRDLATVQSGDVLTTFHRYFPPEELRRYGLYDWRLEDWYKTPPTLKVTGLSVVVTPAPDVNHPAKEWQWVVTWEDEESGRESLASDALTPAGGTIAIYPDKPATIRWPVIVKAARYHVSRGRNAFFGYVGTVEQPAVAAGASPTTVDFRDDGQLPIYSEPPPLWTNPFQSDLSYPACGCYLDDRLVVGGSTVQPATIKGSRVADYYNFDEVFLPGPQSPFDFTLSTRRFEEIRWIVPLERLVVGTSEAEWLVNGAAGGDSPIAGDSVFARSRSHLGSARVQPLVVGEGVVYLQDGAQIVRDFVARAQGDVTAEGAAGRELTILSQHLVEDRTIVDWAYQRAPDSVIWAVGSDGVLLSCTILREHGIAAWARHDSGGDQFEAVTCVPDGTRDVPFFVVKRTINGATKRYVERLATRSPASASVGVFLDCAFTYTGAATNTVSSGISHLEARTVGVLADGTYRGTYVVAAGSITFTGSAATTVLVGLPIVADFESLDDPKGRTRQKIGAHVGVEYRLKPPVSDAAAGIAIGQDAATLSDIRKFSDGPTPPPDGVVFVPVDASFNPGGRCFVRHTQPFPLEIRGLTRVIT